MPVDQISESLDGSTGSGTLDRIGQAKYLSALIRINCFPFPEWKRFNVINLPPNGWLFSLNNGTELGDQHCSLMLTRWTLDIAVARSALGERGVHINRPIKQPPSLPPW